MNPLFESFDDLDMDQIYGGDPGYEAHLAHLDRLHTDQVTALDRLETEEWAAQEARYGGHDIWPPSGDDADSS